MILYILLFWFTCGAIAARMSYIFFWNEYPELRWRPDRESELRKRSVTVFLMGPAGLVALIMMGGAEHGIFVHPKPKRHINYHNTIIENRQSLATQERRRLRGL